MKNVLHENTTEQEIALLAAVDCGEYDAESSMRELEELAKKLNIKVRED